MAVHYIEVPIEIADIDEGIVARGVEASENVPQINVGAFRGLAYALAIEATVMGFLGLGWGLWHFLR